MARPRAARLSTHAPQVPNAPGPGLTVQEPYARTGARGRNSIEFMIIRRPSLFCNIALAERIERAFAARGAPVQVEVSHLSDPEVGNLLTGRGYRLVSYENVLGRALHDAPGPVTPPPGTSPPGVEVRLSAPDELQVWLDVVLEAELQPDTDGLPAEEFPREALERAERDLVAASGTRRYLARRDGIAAGGASFRVAGGIAQFTGAATKPAHRRRGIQTALLAARLADAAAAGCDLAVITTSPGTKSQQNAQRQGFDLLYTRAILVREQG
jgi:GNAT superfamily N-acetyltransferase